MPGGHIYKVCPPGVPFGLELTLKAENLKSLPSVCGYSHGRTGFGVGLMFSPGQLFSVMGLWGT